MQVNKFIDHTLLKAFATEQEILKLCEEAVKYNFKSVCVNPANVKLAKQALEGSDVLVCTVIGFPLGANIPEIKALEAMMAIRDGADEVDMVINIGKAKEHDFDYIEKEIALVVSSSASKCVKVIIETAANNAYESTLTAKMANRNPPTLFQINGPKGYANWKEYCADLKDTELYKHLTDKSLAITDKDGVYGIPYVLEGYGIIYNKDITDKYFALKKRGTSFKNMDEINDFEKLKKLVEDMQKNAKGLGIKGVFASTSLKAGEDWRWQTHLLNIPIYYEFTNK